jgi:hypothetical protein
MPRDGVCDGANLLAFLGHIQGLWPKVWGVEYPFDVQQRRSRQG